MSSQSKSDPSAFRFRCLHRKSKLSLLFLVFLTLHFALGCSELATLDSFFSGHLARGRAGRGSWMGDVREFQQELFFQKTQLTLIHRQATDNKKDEWTGDRPELLRRVNLKVSNTNFTSTKILGTETVFKRGQYMGVCPGDSGGPLMYETRESKRWVIIG